MQGGEAPWAKPLPELVLGARYHAMKSSLHLLFFAIILFGGAWPITKAAVSDACPMWFGFGRAALAMVAATFLLLLLRRFHAPKREDLPTVFAVGILQLGGFFVLAHAAIALVEAAERPNLGLALDAVVRMYEERLKEVTPGMKQITCVV